ncbi:hypothetical protein CKAN_02640700 [Cinnamomum micranthum f. kanehirae]|uniref:Uncharacterized protein n=1 Tax=Cinnamomum micranthum f. kanehirae TaxID=337451 RepID=A0A3S3RAN7_9MAGN|nr:hypothetical protein CKAN_02640700 [Cinnamomum micranthum f. kanehirae]
MGSLMRRLKWRLESRVAREIGLEKGKNKENASSLFGKNRPWTVEIIGHQASTSSTSLSLPNMTDNALSIEERSSAPLSSSSSCKGFLRRSRIGKGFNAEEMEDANVFELRNAKAKGLCRSGDFVAALHPVKDASMIKILIVK